MIRKVSAIVSLTMFVLLIFSCSSKKELAEEELKPDWVKQKPLVSGYYIGVGGAQKIGTMSEYTAKARENALTDMASEISSQVSASSVIHKIESYGGVSESFTERIEITTDDYLEGFEPVDAYETEDMYWVYFRIRKDTYREMKAKKKRKAMQAAAAKYTSGETAREEGKILQALSFYMQGMESLKGYLSEETITDYEGGSLDVGNALYSAIDELVKKLSLEVQPQQISGKKGGEAREALQFTTSYANNPLGNVPLKLEYSGSYLSRDVLESKSEGSVEYRLDNVGRRPGNYKLTAAIDLQRLTNKAVQDLFIRGMMERKSMPEVRVDVLVEAPTMVLEVVDSECEGLQCRELQEMFGNLCRQNGYLKVDEGNTADYRALLSYSYRNGEQAGGLIAVNIKGKLTLIDKNGSTLYMQELKNIEGIGRGAREAREKAFNEMKSALQRRYFDQLFYKVR